MSEMVERLTRIMAVQGMPRGLRFEMLCPESVAEQRGRVRELLAAMREPTEAMERAGDALSEHCFDGPNADAVYRAMIDAALKD